MGRLWNWKATRALWNAGRIYGNGRERKSFEGGGWNGAVVELESNKSPMECRKDLRERKRAEILRGRRLEWGGCGTGKQQEPYGMPEGFTGTEESGNPSREEAGMGQLWNWNRRKRKWKEE